MKQIYFLLFSALFMMTACTDPGRMADNPFYSPSDLPFEAPDFNRIADTHFREAFNDGMEFELQEIEEIAANPDEPTFGNTIVAMERTGVLLNRTRRVFTNLTSAHTNDKLRELQSEYSPKFAAHSDNIYLNRTLFNRVQTLYERREEMNLDNASLKLLEDTYRDFVRAGILLNEEMQQKNETAQRADIFPDYQIPGAFA
jgi:peptidyl-dipeptidase Dcp